MIVTTSGSSAGIGFAVPGDNVKESTDLIVELDKERQLRLIKHKGRGWLGVEVATSYLEESLRKRLAGKNPSNADDGTGEGAFITAVAANSLLLHNRDGAVVTGAISAASLVNGGGIKIGDRIINVGGRDVANGKDFANEMKKRVEGEQITLTVETGEGDARVVYVTLGRIPL
jgi:S1-C subfamily serine protease